MGEEEVLEGDVEEEGEGEEEEEEIDHKIKEKVERKEVDRCMNKASDSPGII